MLLLIYSNSFNVTWHMDDRPNIVDNRTLHLTSIMPHNLWQTFFANQGKAPKLYRPLPCLSFAINWYIGQDNTFGYHLVNFGFHLASAWLLYLLILKLLAVLKLKGSFNFGHSKNIALLAPILWAIHPIQTQAVTYIVQRMAVMAAFFYILGMLYYVKARTAETSRQRWIFGLLCGLWFLFAVGSKENAILLPFSLILLEWIFFRGGNTNFLYRPLFWLTMGGTIGLSLILLFLWSNGTPIDMMRNWYNSRPFTFEERIMTQPRIVLGYLTQIFYPLPERLSITHDVNVSTSIFHPWTTLPAMIIILSVILVACAFAHRFPLVAFGILFFFLNHIVESTILPLEMVFEHRNYLPSLFLFLPVAFCLQWFLLKIRKNSCVVHTVMGSAIIMIIINLGLSTYTRNAAWATEISLWSDAARKAPNSIRPLVTLGIKYGWKENPSPSDYQLALALFQRSLELPQMARKTERAEILGNMASVYFNLGENEKAIAIYQQALELNPDYLKNRFDIVKPLVVSGRFEEAKEQLIYLLKKRPNNLNYWQLLGFVFLWQEKFDKALECFQIVLSGGNHSLSLLLNTGITLTRLESWDRGRWFCQLVLKMNQRDLFPLLALIENRARAGDPDEATAYARRAISQFPVTQILSRLESAPNDFRSAPISPEYIAPFIEKELEGFMIRNSSNQQAVGVSEP